MQRLFNEYPRQFWLLTLGVFIDRLGTAMLIPFFSLYVTSRFDVGMTAVGVFLTVYFATGLIGSTISGGFTDKFGRKNMMLFGLISSALSSLILAIINDLALLYLAAAFVGIFSSIGEPAQQTMVADLLPAEKRAEGFGIIRVVLNLSFVVGPAVGGFLAGQAFELIFVTDALTSLLTAGVVFLGLNETLPSPDINSEPETLAQTFRGYLLVLRDAAYMGFVVITMGMTLVYMQMNTSLPVFLHQEHGISPQHFGYLLALNATLVVLFQFSISRQMRGHPPMLMMVLGSLFLAGGFGLYGFVSSYGWFMLAMGILTIGEMIVTPTGQALASQFAPENMRGRYMALFQLGWTLPAGIGPLLAGMVMDNTDPRWVWYLSLVVCMATAMGYLGLNRVRLVKTAPQP